jgi:hypothetical protein
MSESGFGALIALRTKAHFVDKPGPDRMGGKGGTTHRHIVRQLSLQVANRLRIEFPLETRLRCRNWASIENKQQSRLLRAFLNTSTGPVSTVLPFFDR